MMGLPQLFQTPNCLIVWEDLVSWILTVQTLKKQCPLRCSATVEARRTGPEALARAPLETARQQRRLTSSRGAPEALTHTLQCAKKKCYAVSKPARLRYCTSVSWGHLQETTEAPTMKSYRSPTNRKLKYIIKTKESKSPADKDNPLNPRAAHTMLCLYMSKPSYRFPFALELL